MTTGPSPLLLCQKQISLMPAPISSVMALFIDGANLYTTAKVLGFGIDYDRLLKEFKSRGTLVRAFFYTTIIEDQDNVLIRPLLDWLDYNGYTVVTKAAKEYFDSIGRRKIKRNIDIELTVDAMELADQIDEMVRFSGYGDFRRLVEAMQRRGVRVTVSRQRRPNRRSSPTNCDANPTFSPI